MAGFTTYLEDKVMDHVFRNTAYSSPAAVYLGLFTAAPSDAGGGTEVSGGSYAREAITFGASSSGAISNTAAVTFTTATGDWGTLTHFGVFDAVSGVNLLAWAALTTPKTVGTGDTFEVAIGDLDLTLD